MRGPEPPQVETAAKVDPPFMPHVVELSEMFFQCRSLHRVAFGLLSTIERIC